MIIALIIILILSWAMVIYQGKVWTGKVLSIRSHSYDSMFAFFETDCCVYLIELPTGQHASVMERQTSHDRQGEIQVGDTVEFQRSSIFSRMYFVFKVDPKEEHLIASH